MSLTGKLKDLSAIDILQILSVSKRTGVLSIEAGEGKINIVFKNGLIVSASSPSPHSKSLGQTLLERRSIDPLLLEQLLQVQKERGNEPLGSILLEAGAIEEETLREILKERIREVIFGLKNVNEGNFNFTASDVIPFDDILYDPDEVRLETGWQPRHLLESQEPVPEPTRANRRKTIPFHASGPAALKARRPQKSEEVLSFLQTKPAADAGALNLKDLELPEMPELPDVGFDLIAEQIDFHVTPAADSFAPITAPESSRAKHAGTILLVEDEAMLRQLLSRRFTEKGYEIFQTDNPAEGLRIARQLLAARTQFAIISDLVMPTSSGSGFLGGLELVEAVRKINTKVPIVMMTDYEDARAQNRAYSLGLFDFHKKPILTRSSVEDTEKKMNAFAELLIEVLKHPPYRLHTPEEEADFWKDIKIDLPGKESPRSATNLMQQVNALQQTVREGGKSSQVPEVSSVILRYAADFFDRGMLFVVKKDEVHGLIGFGETGEIESMRQKTRRMKFSLNEDSIFSKVYRQKHAHFGKLADTPTNRQFVSLLGRVIPASIAMFPLLAGHDPVGMFYGDNAISHKPLKDLEGLEIFLAQTGIVIQRSAARHKWRTGKFR